MATGKTQANGLSKQKIAGIKRSKRYKALLAAECTPDEAVAIITGQYATPAPVVEAVEAEAKPEPKTQKELADELLEASDFVRTRGRVYLTPATLEAIARAMKGGKPAIVETDGFGRTKALLVFRENDDSKAVAVQNLTVEE